MDLPAVEKRKRGEDQYGVVWRTVQKYVVCLVLSLTCRETHCNNYFCLAGGKRGRRWVIKRRGAVNLPLGWKVHKKIQTNNTDETTALLL